MKTLITVLSAAVVLVLSSPVVAHESHGKPVKRELVWTVQLDDTSGDCCAECVGENQGRVCEYDHSVDAGDHVVEYFKCVRQILRHCKIFCVCGGDRGDSWFD